MKSDKGTMQKELYKSCSNSDIRSCNISTYPYSAVLVNTERGSPIPNDVNICMSGVCYFDRCKPLLK